MLVKSATPFMVVEEIEPCLDFWIRRIGFEKTTEVPHEDRLGFVILLKDDVQVMLQTQASLSEDLPRIAEAGGGTATALFAEVDNIDAVERALEGAEIVQPRRKTFYGSTEIAVREPGGHFVTFAQFGAVE
ncbi:MAG: VOC family protein [Gemmatimonadota bacterium]